jgi:hypothetical protein
MFAELGEDLATLGVNAAFVMFDFRPPRMP